MGVTPTKCPELNDYFRGLHSAANLEVLVRYSEGVPGKEEITGLICSKYDKESKTCKLDKEAKLCPYAAGFNNI